MPESKCSTCKWNMAYQLVGGEHVLHICTGEPPEEEPDGSLMIFEIGKFLAEHCMVFKKKD